MNEYDIPSLGERQRKFRLSRLTDEARIIRIRLVTAGMLCPFFLANLKLLSPFVVIVLRAINLNN